MSQKKKDSQKKLQTKLDTIYSAISLNGRHLPYAHIQFRRTLLLPSPGSIKQKVLLKGHPSATDTLDVETILKV